MAEPPDSPSAATATGLTAEEVAARVADGRSNRTEADTSESWGRILRRNALTRLNFLLLVLGAATLTTGALPDATFLAVAVINTVVGAVEESRAKRQLDRLAVVSAPRTRAVRAGSVVDLAVEDVVLDDLLELRPGDQLSVDAVVVEGAAEVDESLTTGESEPVAKSPGDDLLSGTWVVAGVVRARVTRVGRDSYANRLAAEARRFSLAGSELVAAVNRVLRWVTWAMVVIGPVLFWRQVQHEPWRVAVRLAVAGIVGMIPEGLVLLTTLAFLASAVRLTRLRTLVQELPAIETLARVDSLCVDKTGTLTQGRVTFAALEVRGAADDDVRTALDTLARATGANATLAAIAEAAGTTTSGWRVEASVPFSSARKWSAVRVADHGTWVLGAPEMVEGADPDALRPLGESWAEAGSRVLALAHGDEPLEGERLPDDLRLVALVALAERVRPTVAATIAYFSDQGVTLRVISGDAVATVRAIARAVGVPDAGRALDARDLHPGEEAFAELVESSRVFGRSTPEVKREMVAALRARGHTVAMTGDGVNDVLALKTADLGVAMGSGAAITRGVAQLVLLDDDFDVMPAVVAEGRRALANIERVAALFFTKNIYSLVLSVVVSIAGSTYPLLPRQLTLVGSVAIGIPGFFLALGPNDRRFEPGFLRRVLTLSVVAGTVSAAAILAAYGLARSNGAPAATARVAAVTAAAVVTLWLIAVVARPVTRGRLALVAAMAALFLVAYAWGPAARYFDLATHPGGPVELGALALGVVGALVVETVTRVAPLRGRILPPSVAADPIRGPRTPGSRSRPG